MDEQEPANGATDRRVNGEQDATTSSTISQVTGTRWLSILQDVTAGATSNLNLHELMQGTLNRVREAMAVDNAAMLLVNADGTSLTMYAACGPEEKVTGKVQIPMGRGIAGTIAAGGIPMIIDDLSQVEVENPLLRATASSLLGVPLLAGQRVIGVMHVGSALPRRFTAEDSQLLQVIASHVTLAIEYAQLYETERAARSVAETTAHQLQALQAISDVAIEHARLDDLLQALLQRIQQMFAADNVAILLPAPDGQELTLYSVRGPEEAVMGLVHVPMGQGVAGTIAATRQPLFVENLQTVPVANPFLREHFRSLLGVPLLAGEHLIGVIHVDSVRPRRFTDSERQLLEELAERIAAAIARAQAYERTRRDREEAEHHVEVLRETTERMDEFLSIASHELRTPLTTLTMNIQLLDVWLNSERNKREDESPAEYALRAVTRVRPLIPRSNRSVMRLDRLVGELLEASRMREDRVALQLQRFDLIPLVHEVVDEQQQAHASRDLKLKVEAQAPFIVYADPDRIAQVVSNYISNALKYSPPDRPISVAVQAGGDQASVSVRDEGFGIPEHDLSQIWERFYRVEGITHQSGSEVGLGLGLYISREIVERHGGQVGVRSTLGEGSTFWFTLPLARARQAGE